MSLDVRASETGLIRVFALSMDADAALALRNNHDAQMDALGADHLDIDFTEVFPVSDLAGLGLSGYLTTGNGVPADRLADDRAKLDALDGWVFLVFSNAFDGVAQTLRPSPDLTLIGTYAEEGVDWSPVQIDTPSAKPFSGAMPPPQDPPKTPFNLKLWISLGIAAIALMILLFR